MLSALCRFVGTVLAFLVFAVACWHRNGSTAIDRALISSYHPNPSSRLFQITTTFTNIGSPVAVAVLGVTIAAYFWVREGSRSWALACLGAPAIAGAIEATLKIVAARPRPMTALLAGESGNGFPSGHAAGFSALAITTALAFRATRPRSRTSAGLIIATVGSALMASSRVILGVHYPTDVLAGLLVGFGVAQVCSFLAANARHIQRGVQRDGDPTD